MENQRNTYDLLNSINGFIIDVKFLTVSSNMAFVARNVTENYINISRLPMGILLSPIIVSIATNNWNFLDITAWATMFMLIVRHNWTL